MHDKSQRVAGIFIAPLMMLAGLWLCLEGLEHGGLSGIFMLAGLWLCLEGLEHGGLSGIFSIGPFVAVAGAVWFASDWFE